jgi:hypothetical protein
MLSVDIFPWHYRSFKLDTESFYYKGFALPPTYDGATVVPARPFPFSGRTSHSIHPSKNICRLVWSNPRAKIVQVISR